MVGYIFLLVSVFLVFLGKAVADTVSNETSWFKSIFSSYPIDSFWGAKDHTWTRKYKWKNNKILNYLFTTILVWTTDIWHFANTIRRLGIYLSILSALVISQNTFLHSILIVLVYAFINILGFHLFYTYFLKKK